jgi:hypothetical protein
MRGISAAHLQSIGDSARLFALANMAASDALITAWDSKTHWNFWRPITAIREGDNDGNSKTVGDPGWLPFIATPPYPDYTSGANNLTAAIARTRCKMWLTSASIRAFTSELRTKSPADREHTLPTGRSATTCGLFSSRTRC